MANYKKIVDVDVLAEASESTNVLVEENGSLKKVPASAVGGGGKYDFVLEFETDGPYLWNEQDTFVHQLDDGVFEKLRQVCESGHMPKALLINKYAYGDIFDYNYFESNSVSTWLAYNEISFYFCVPFDLDGRYGIEAYIWHNDDLGSYVVEIIRNMSNESQ